MGHPTSAITSPRFRWLAPLAFGSWAAAIALAPSLTVKALLAAPAVILPLVWWTLQGPTRWLTLFLGAALLLPPLPIPIGDSGPHPCMLAAALGMFAGLFWLRDWRFGNLSGTDDRFSSSVILDQSRQATKNDGLSHQPALALIALFGVMLASVAMAAFHSGAEVAAGSLSRVALFGISVYVFLYAAYGPGREKPGSISYLYWVALASALFGCVDFYYQFPAPAGYGPQFVWLDTGVFRRAQGLFYEASTLGNFCAFFLVMIGVALTRPREASPVSRKALLFGGVIFFAALVLSYSRASLLNVLVAFGILAWIERRRIRWSWVAGGLAVSILLVWRIFPTFAEVYWVRLSNTTEYFFTATESVLSGRAASWRTLADWIQANPWQVIFGIGYKTLPYSDYLGGPVIADNMYLSLLVETGIAGLLALLWLNFAILRTAWRASQSTAARTSFCGIWMLCFWAGESIQMLSGDLLTYWRVLPVYFWVLALALRS